MEEINIKAAAKINLALDIKNKRDDGYHEVATIMHSTALFDNLFIKKVYKPDYLKVVSNIVWLPTDDKNLAYRAAEYLKARFAVETGIFVNLTKNIPVSAGLGGGSANCAAALKGVRNLFKLPLTDADLAELGAKFGADVPFCVKGGAALATGIGEKLTPLRKLPFCHILLVKPPVIVSTEEVFRDFDPAKVKARPDIEKLVYFLENKDLSGLAANMVNVLESVTAAQNPIIYAIKEEIMALGALGAAMTGSGPTVFGIFERRESAERAMAVIKAKYPDFTEIFLTKSQ
ncbi:MAG: 4-(cytidine 5'-diphospho)-2-C-methyl-D-erythritol kinase [Clostridiales bacterium]|jgi:4-diphosphocytidyl-2-C-methyl-D-erythritol kinase|nr:4-(cytidine 5'-diphospho)-2-C-methyl-D-erythritol kinase [Clostridiales bacterium]